MYSANYIDYIFKGLKKTTYLINNSSINREKFFEKLVEKTKYTQEKKGRLFFFGNGASAAFSNHMALDWSKNGKVLSFSLSDSALLTALANDYSYGEAFLEFLKINNPTQNDIVCTTSSSGNSKNVVTLLEYCRKKSITTFALSGLNEGNKSTQLANFSLFVPAKTYGMVECIHQVFHHLWLDLFMNIKEWQKTESQNMDATHFKL